MLAAAGIIAIYVVPNLKYPANPPSVGDPETIQLRTALYFGMIAISVAGMIVAWKLRGVLVSRFGDWDAFLISAAAYVAAMALAGILLPPINEVQDGFPAVVLWHFRIASAGAQLIMWMTIGLAFGALVERRARGSSRVSIGASIS